MLSGVYLLPEIEVPITFIIIVATIIIIIIIRPDSVIGHWLLSSARK
jgi:hypothetical protein